MSQSRRVLSRLPIANVRPSGENASAPGSAEPRASAASGRGRPPDEEVSQSRTLPSRPATARVRPSGDQASVDTPREPPATDPRNALVVNDCTRLACVAGDGSRRAAATPSRKAAPGSLPRTSSARSNIVRATVAAAQ